MTRNIFIAVGLLAVVASLAMFMVGSNSSHMSELKEFWWAPLPVAIICFLVASKKKA